MLNEKPLEMIENLVKIIYSPDQIDLDNAFIQVLDSFSEMIMKMEEIGYRVDMTEELELLQAAYVKRDLTELADVLLYDVKPGLLEIKE